MKIPRLTSWQQWLIHAFVVWAIVDLNDAVTYWYDVRTNGVYLVNPDGSPVTQWQRFVNHNYYQGFWAVILVITLFVEINYHFVFKRKPLAVFLVSSVLLAIVFVGLLIWFNQWKFGGRVMAVWGPGAVTVGYSVGYALLRNFVDQRIQQAHRQIRHSQAELTALKAQLNPHFFFNTLNSLYGTALEERATNTANSIEQLAGIMRHTISEARHDFTDVANELKFIDDYVQLQRLRLPERETIRLQTHLHYDGQPARIAPLLLITFVENAFTHGISIDHDCFVTIRLTIENGQLDFRVENSVIPGRPPTNGLGTGILNAQQRLQLLYPNRHQLTYRAETDRYRVSLRIDLH